MGYWIGAYLVFFKNNFLKFYIHLKIKFQFQIKIITRVDQNILCWRRNSEKLNRSIKYDDKWNNFSSLKKKKEKKN